MHTSFNPKVHIVRSFSLVLHFRLSFSCFLTFYHSPSMLLFHPSSLSSSLPPLYPTMHTSFNRKVHVVRSFSLVLYFRRFFLLLSYILPLALYAPVSRIFTFLLSSSTISSCLLNFLNLPLFVQEAMNAIRAIENTRTCLIASVYSVNDKVTDVCNGSSGSLKMHCYGTAPFVIQNIQ